MPPQSILPRNSWFADSSLEQTGFEPLVPLKNGQAPRADRDGSLCLPGQLKNDGGTTSSNPLSSSGESAELRYCANRAARVRAAQSEMGPRVRIRFPPGKSQANFPTALTRPNRSHLRAHLHRYGVVLEHTREIFCRLRG